MDYCKIYIFFSGLLFSVLFGHVAVKYLNRILRGYINQKENPVERDPAKLTPTVGCIERAIYTLLFVGNYSNFIIIAFSIKIAQRLILLSKLDTYEKVRSAGERINVYLICNIVNLLFGLVGGWLIKYFLVVK